MEELHAESSFLEVAFKEIEPLISRLLPGVIEVLGTVTRP